MKIKVEKECPNCQNQYLEIDVEFMQEKFGPEWQHAADRKDWSVWCRSCGDAWALGEIDKVVGYATAIFARNDESMQINSSWVASARSEDEAFGIGVRMAKEAFPREEGFYHHGAAVLPVYESNL